MSTSNGGLSTIKNGTGAEDHEVSKEIGNLSLSSQTMHADDYLNTYADVAPAMHVSTTFRYSNDADKLVPMSDLEPGSRYDGHIYSRYTTPNTTRLESILTQILHGPTLTYSSGLSAFHAALIHLNPRRISIGNGYHGCHGVISIHQKLTGLQKLPLDCPPEDLQLGDIVHIETPINPTGEAYNLQEFADKAHSRGAYLVVDATFGPPPLQDPFLFGADVVMHSGTKYFGGHSDMLCGILAVNPKHCLDSSERVGKDGKGVIKGSWWKDMEVERMHLGSVMGNMEGWLGVRSVRTLELRVQRQSYNVGKLVSFLNDSLQSSADTKNPVQHTVGEILHASLQTKDASWLKKQMPNGYGPVFAVVMKTEALAKRLPGKLRLFHHSTSLGGVESLIEWRAMSDSTVDRRLLRVSVGVEGWEDLRDDLVRGLGELAREVEGVEK